MPYWPARPLR